MKNIKSIIVGAAVILGAAGIIWGNHALASGALAEGNTQEPAIVMPGGAPASALRLSDVGMYSNSEGVVFMALANNDTVMAKQEETQTTYVDSPETYQNPTNGNLSEEEAKQLGIKAIAEKFGLTPSEIERFDVAIRARYTPTSDTTTNMRPSLTVAEDSPAMEVTLPPSSESDILLWIVTLTPINQQDYPTIESYSVLFDDQSQEVMKAQAVPLFKEGTPLANEISSEKAQEIGIAAIVKKYALAQKTLEKFTITLKYYEVTPEAPGKHVWWVNLYPTDNDDFSEIGCYWTYIDAETEEVLQLNSAADGKG